MIRRPTLPSPALRKLLTAGVVALAVAAPIGYAQTPAGPASPTASPVAKPAGAAAKPQGKPHGAGPASPEQLAADVTRTTEALATAKSDLAAVQGRVDAGAVQGLIARAEQLVGTARGLQSTDTARADEYVHAARDATKAARDLMVAGVGGPLPSDASRTASSAVSGGTPKPGHAGAPKPGHGAGSTGLPAHLQGADQASIDAYRQAGAGRELQHLYDNLTKLATATGSPPDEAAELLTTARGLYRQGYEQYQARQHARAADLGHAGKSAANAAKHILQATGAIPMANPSAPPPAPPQGW